MVARANGQASSLWVLVAVFVGYLDRGRGFALKEEQQEGHNDDARNRQSHNVGPGSNSGGQRPKISTPTDLKRVARVTNPSRKLQLLLVG